MIAALVHAEALLRADRFSATRAGPRLLELMAFIVLCGCGYGAVMGTFGGVSGERMLQIVYAAFKVPLLLLGTFVVSLPSFFVLNTLFGVRSDFREALDGLFATQAGLTILLVALAPYTAIWYASSTSYNAAVLFNGFMFGIASITAQWLLRRHYAPLVARNPRHRVLLRVWLIIYVFVGIQMGWVLRPFVGLPGLPVQFFRSEAWGNAYVEVARKIWQAVSP